MEFYTRTWHIILYFIIYREYKASESGTTYFKIGIFARTLFSRIALNDIFTTLDFRKLGHDLPISLSDRNTSPLREGFIFTKLRMCEVS